MGAGARVAWVTGAGRGIGRACAVALAHATTDIAVTARTEKDVLATAKACEAAGVRAFATRCDVTSREEVEQAYGAIRSQLGTPSILVNNAGLGRSAPFLKTTVDFMDLHWRTNVLGTFHCAQVALPAMVESGHGRIVNLASTAGKTGAPYIAAYAASKHAVLGLTRSLAAEFAGKGVTVNAVCPGYVDTPMTEENIRVIVERTGMTAADARQRLEKQSPQGRFTSPEEVAALVVYLCSDRAANLNGQAITMDGGAVQW